MSAADSSEFDLLAELSRYKKLYEQEKEQLEEFQHYSKELEAEMDMELVLYKKKVTEVEAQNRKLQAELEETKRRYEKERNDFLASENLLRTKLTTSEEACKDLRQKLRKVEQANDDLERRERIQSQELADWAVRYEKCLERCAFLEAGMFSGEDNNMDATTTEATTVAANSEMEETRISSSSTAHSSGDVTSSAPNGDWLQRVLSDAGTQEDGFVSPPASRMRLADDYSSSRNSSRMTSGTPTDGSNALGRENRRSSEIVSNLFRKIEEVERQVNPKKYIIYRTQNHRK